MSKTYDLGAIMDLPLSTNLLKHALEKENEAQSFAVWNNLYPLMMIGRITFKSFDDFKNGIFKQQTKTSSKTSEEIMEEMMAIAKVHEGR